MDKDDEERLMDFIEKQMERAKQDAKEDESETSKHTPLVRPENDAPLVLDLKLKPKPKLLAAFSIKQQKTKSESVSEDNKPNVSSGPNDETDKKKRKQRFDDKEAESKDSKRTRTDDSSSASEGWIREGLTVKITTRSLGDKYYRAKGVVQSVGQDGFVGKVKLKTPKDVDGHVIRLDQEYLETVVPAAGKVVLILWGRHKGKRAVVKKFHPGRCSMDVELEKEKRIVENLPYEQICKYAG